MSRGVPVAQAQLRRADHVVTIDPMGMDTSLLHGQSPARRCPGAPARGATATCATARLHGDGTLARSPYGEAAPMAHGARRTT
jgi:hypothetical protein